MISEHLQHKLALLPAKPGCYIMKDENGEILYVGKAKVLKNRVRSYFHGVHDFKTTRLVSRIRDFEFIVTGSEKESLLLEINLIKKHRPPFNIMFMDDKSYPYIEVTGTNPVAVRITRRTTSKKSVYFGPYPSSTSASEIVKLINQLFETRKCRTLPKEACLYYHMHQCLAPCIHPISDEQNRALRTSIIKFLKGDTEDIRDRLVAERDAASEALLFEKAAQLQASLESLDHVMERQTIDLTDKQDRDVFAWYEDKGYISIYGLMLRQGKMLGRALSVTPIYADIQEEFVSFILQYYASNVVPRQILVPQGTDTASLEEALDTKVKVPERGEKKKLLDMAAGNARTAHEQKFALAYKRDAELEKANDKLSEIFHRPIHRVEMFDNSHLQGTFNVSGLVVFRDGSPDKSQYRHYQLDEYRSDIDSMKEVIYRRYFRLLREARSMPDLLLVDGGITQIHAALEIRDSLGLTFPVAGLAKDDKHNTRALIDEAGQEIPLDRQSPLFFLLTRMQDEVHRFAISYHQKLRGKSMTTSILDSVAGVGPVRKRALMKEFRSMKNLRAASLDQLEKVVPSAVAQTLYARLHEKSEEDYNETNDEAG